MKRKTFFTLIIIAFVLSFFVTPVGYWGKIWLMRLFASPPEIIHVTDRKEINTYDWKLKDANWDFFNFQRSKGKVVFVHFWASWNTPSAAELKGIQTLYDAYSDKVDFYIVTNEEREPVEEFMGKNKYTFPVTYRIVGADAPFEIPKVQGTYIIDKNGAIVVDSKGTHDWDSDRVTQLLESLF
ncbi:Thiol-disulfide isomerase or thioredoxin [Zobellia uliginosa]|uniref:Thiol-disulfide isomerase or thioredoxin n=1 Tax=Zobellia uliginosa TaxID=143224 RepID=A0ABY1KXZ3_9FLAO|nr:TlpA disulfide reductase family protein [Zobellia uliginosa]SIS89853.1 Thiol-disulfide isomerase or thioredoxin [Zobellia uliginosa]